MATEKGLMGEEKEPIAEDHEDEACDGSSERRLVSAFRWFTACRSP